MIKEFNGTWTDEGLSMATRRQLLREEIARLAVHASAKTVRKVQPGDREQQPANPATDHPQEGPAS
jgi:hypothetical protein